MKKGLYVCFLMFALSTIACGTNDISKLGSAVTVLGKSCKSLAVNECKLPRLADNEDEEKPEQVEGDYWSIRPAFLWDSKMITR